MCQPIVPSSLPGGWGGMMQYIHIYRDDAVQNVYRNDAVYIGMMQYIYRNDAVYI